MDYQPTAIGSRPHPLCPLCGSGGEPLHNDLQDRLFGAPGRWSLRRCPRPGCGLVWLDPMPLAEEIGLAYRRYYTHEGAAEAPRGGLAKALWRAVQAVLWRLSGVARRRRALELLCLEGVAPGRLLEVGCGDGSRLLEFAALGWRAEGQEVDPAAAAAAEQRTGAPVHRGPVETLALPAGGFDAVVMNHVIEHVHDPVGLLCECRRLLRPGGLLVAVTPNVAGRGHRRFGRRWRGLEPPRHLHLFNPATLATVAGRAGFPRHEAWTSAAHAESFARASLELGGAARGLSLALRATLWQLTAELHRRLAADSGDECILKAWA